MFSNKKLVLVLASLMKADSDIRELKTLQHLTFKDLTYIEFTIEILTKNFTFEIGAPDEGQ